MHVYVCMCMYVYEYMHVWIIMYVLMHACRLVYLCPSIRMAAVRSTNTKPRNFFITSMWMWVPDLFYEWMNMYLCMYVYAYKCMYVRMGMYNKDVNIYLHIHTYIHTYMHALTHIFITTYLYTHTYAHIYLHLLGNGREGRGSDCSDRCGAERNHQLRRIL